MKFLRNLNAAIISIILTVVYGVAFGIAKILMLATSSKPKSSDSYWIPEKQKINSDYQSPY